MARLSSSGYIEQTKKRERDDDDDDAMNALTIYNWKSIVYIYIYMFD